MDSFYHATSNALVAVKSGYEASELYSGLLKAEIPNREQPRETSILLSHNLLNFGGVVWHFVKNVKGILRELAKGTAILP